MRVYIFLFLFISFLPVSSFAFTTLTFDECITLAKEHNKRIDASRFQAESAKFDKRIASAAFLPSFTVTGSGIYSSAGGKLGIGNGLLPVVDSEGISTGTSAYFPGLKFAYDVDWIYSAGVKVEQPLYMGGRIRNGYKMAKIGESIAFQNCRLTEAEVVAETSRAYANVLRSEKTKEVATSYNTLLKELMRSVERAYSQGVKSKNDVLKVKVKLDESELNLRRADNALRLATMNLCHYIGFALTENVKIDTVLPEVEKSLHLEADVTSRPEKQILALKSELMRLNVSAAYGEMLPQIGIVGQYGYMYGFKLNGNNLFDKDNFMLGVQMSVPLFHFGSRMNKYRSAKMKYEQVRLDEEDKVSLMILEAVQAVDNLDEAVYEQQLAETTLVSAMENLRTSRKQYDVGFETLSDHLEAQTLWRQAEQTLIDARINRFLCWVEYCRVTGK